MQQRSKFTRSSRFGLQSWTRNDDPAVIVAHYPKIHRVRPGVFYVYRANKRVASLMGGSLREALRVAEAA